MMFRELLDWKATRLLFTDEKDASSAALFGCHLAPSPWICKDRQRNANVYHRTNPTFSHWQSIHSRKPETSARNITAEFLKGQRLTPFASER